LGTNPLSEQIEALKEVGMSEAQAKDFADKWTVVKQYQSSLLADGFSGLGATIFQEKNGTKQCLAIQGTDSLSDLFVDLAFLLPLGLSYTNPQYGKLLVVIKDWLQPGGGLQKDFTITGHSLGGYLAVALGIDADKGVFSGDVNVSHIYTYNAPGQGGVIGNLVGAVLGNIFDYYPDPSGISNIRGSAGWDLIGGLGMQLSPPSEVETEDGSFNIITNHKIGNWVNTLALQNTFAKLDPNVTIEQLNQIMAASGNDADLERENTLDALRKTIGITNTTDDEATANGNDFWSHLLDLEQFSAYKALIGKVTISTDPISATEARSDFGVFLSLVNLTPFTLKTTDATALATLKSVNQTLATQWEDDLCLSPELLANGEGHYSDSWLTDRAHMLSQLILRNTDADMKGTENFQDLASNLNFSTNSGADLSPDNKYYVFGDDNANTNIQGGNQGDHLYGMGGSDILTGNKGNDYLEGGADSDTYIFTTGDGFDTINDTDGQGVITVDGENLSGGQKLGSNVWQSTDTDHKYTYTWMDATANGDLLITQKDSPNDRILIKHFHKDYLGITLEDSNSPPPAPPQTTNTRTGNVLIPDWEDYLQVTKENDLLQGLGGDDQLEGKEGDDILEGGTGSDGLSGDDLLNGLRFY
jgi:Ca2+-binding RTX toxin-like protein